MTTETEFAVVVILDVDNFLGLFGAEIAAARDQIIVVEMPDQRGPGVVEHPLDDAGGDVFVAAVGFEHGAFVVVSRGLGFALVIIERSGGAVAAIEAVGENVDRGEALAACVEIPILVHGPEMILGNKFREALRGGNRRAGTGFGVVAEGPARFGIGEPVDRRNVFVGTASSSRRNFR